jgi:hypothetical protein
MLATLSAGASPGRYGRGLNTLPQGERLIEKRPFPCGGVLTWSAIETPLPRECIGLTGYRERLSK